MARLSFRCDDELVKKVDHARGLIPREAFLRAAIAAVVNAQPQPSIQAWQGFPVQTDERVRPGEVLAGEAVWTVEMDDQSHQPFVSFRCDDDLLARVDERRGDVARERWLRRAIERELTDPRLGDLTSAYDYPEVEAQERDRNRKYGE